MVGALRSEMVRQRSGGQRTRRRLLLGIEAAARDEQLVLIWRELLTEQRQVSRSVCHGAQERMDVRRRARGVQHRVFHPTRS